MTNKIELNKWGVKEMTLEEMQETDGGFWGFVIAAAEIIYDLCTTTDKEFKSGVEAGRTLAGAGSGTNPKKP